MKKFIVFFVVIVLAIFAGGFFGKTLQSKDVKGSIVQSTPILSTPSPTPVPLSKPVRISIPKLNIQTQVEYVGNDAKGNMDVPKNDDNVAWYQPGFLPGAKGNAVLAGHFDRKNGGPAVFYHLNTLESGDEISITDEKGKELTFVVKEKNKYPVASFPVETVFGPADGKYLNLITCEGVFDKTAQLYSDRLVVTAEFKE